LILQPYCLLNSILKDSQGTNNGMGWCLLGLNSLPSSTAATIANRNHRNNRNYIAK